MGEVESGVADWERAELSVVQLAFRNLVSIIRGEPPP